MKFIRSLGLMSGTSMDGLDCGLFDISLTSDYQLDWKLIDFKTIPYSKKMRNMLDESIYSKYDVNQDLDDELGRVFVSFINKFLKDRNVAIIASHGQTIFHKDGISSTQIGNPLFIYKEYNVPVIYNFRQADIDAGGNGAPLMPFLDWLLFRDKKMDIVTINIGGISNISYIPVSSFREKVRGFDTGPGMALIDETCRLYLSVDMDKDGFYASKGEVNNELLNQLMSQKFISKVPPKSTGRDVFGINLIEEIRKERPGILIEDLLRTFCAFTAKSIAVNLKMFLNLEGFKCDIIISGGGIHHPVIMNDIQKYLPMANIKLADDYGISSDMKESLLMAVLAVARFQNMPSNMPLVTGLIYE